MLKKKRKKGTLSSITDRRNVEIKVTVATSSVTRMNKFARVIEVDCMSSDITGSVLHELKIRHQRSEKPFDETDRATTSFNQASGPQIRLICNSGSS